MPLPTELPTWEIRPAADGRFHWAVASASEVSSFPPAPPPNTLTGVDDSDRGTRLPSLADLLILVHTQIPVGVEDGRADGGGMPIFRTASGRSVFVSDSSVNRARSVLGEADSNNRGNEAHSEVGNKDNDFQLLYTGSGKSLALKESSSKKAAAIIEGHHIREGNEAHSNTCIRDSTLPIFCTASGKSVTIKDSSIRKAAAILEAKDVNDEQLHEQGNRTFFNSMFQTSLGRTVNVSSCGLARATTLLGLEEDDKIFALKGFGSAQNQDSMQIMKGESSHGILSRNMSCVTTSTRIVDPSNVRLVERSPDNFLKGYCSAGSHLNSGQLQKTLAHKMDFSNFTQSPVRFQTAGGRCISISNDALNRARNLLGNSDIGTLENSRLDQCLSSNSGNSSNPNVTFCNKENISYPSDLESISKPVFRTPSSISKRKQPSSHTWKVKSEGDVLDQGIDRNFAFGNDYSGKKAYINKKPEKDNFHLSNNSIAMDDNPMHGPLVEISNNRFSSRKLQPGKLSSASPFKRPRNSRFATPLKNTSLATGFSKLPTQSSCHSQISTHYPCHKRKNIKEFFGGAPRHQHLLGSLSSGVSSMNADNVLNYKFQDASSHDGIGIEAFQDMLFQSGASLSNATKEWVTNHYRWIVWKLACYERWYHNQTKNKFFTVSNVLEELKYRYEREFNHGHRSAIKRILDGDASPSSMMILCVSVICSAHPVISKTDDKNSRSEVIKQSNNSSSTLERSTYDARIELTDGWYSLYALLDAQLSKQIFTGKLFVGQKLRIWGAGLFGWAGPVSSLEASKTVHLLMNINGTYRADWAEKLGFCNCRGAPLSFNCIKAGGGRVPRTLVGITRVYPLLYKERFSDGGYIVRSERLERKALQQYDQRRCSIAEAILAERIDVVADVDSNDEGAKLYKILETTAEPEVMMADMTSQQLISFSAYKTKQNEIRQSDMEKKIEKMLKDAGLCSREVTPFMRVKVAGLTSKHSCKKGKFREGLITIWNPTEDQKVDLVEGRIYDVAGLLPMSIGMGVLYLQGGGSSTAWKSLPLTEAKKYEPFFKPRKSIKLSNFGAIPLASEFDIAAVILHVGDVCISGRQKKQWVFVSDGCTWDSTLQYQGQLDCLLAISFRSPFTGNDLSALFSHHHEGTVVGFFNLVKRARDQSNHLWVAEATENSTYSACYNLPSNCHLKTDATFAQRWAKLSSSIIQELKERILYIVGHD
ncbi:protein BREAST CANCER SUSCEPTIBILITY 2 homolog B-like [Curcuma longa]|uniref:protein BREAST CANCER SUSCEPTIBILITY 2 homolog B-like n=1 Tax=Curcuma longa TaxID=136217 RepID=UPI003D9E8677